MAGPIPAAEAEGTNAQSTDRLTCAQCGYLLRGLDGVARCPECGLEIDQTLAMTDLRPGPDHVASLAVLDAPAPLVRHRDGMTLLGPSFPRPPAPG